MKKGIVFVLCASLMISLCSCGGNITTTTAESNVESVSSISETVNDIESSVESEEPSDESTLESETSSSDVSNESLPESVSADVGKDEVDSESSLDEDMEELRKIGEVEVENGLLYVKITVPKEIMGEEITQEELDASAGEMYTSVVLNEDGSATYKLTKAQHKKMLDELKKQLDVSIEDIVNDENYSITDIKYNDDLSQFDATLETETLGFADTFVAYTFFFESVLYGIFNGKQVDNVIVNYYDPNGGLIETLNSADMDTESSEEATSDAQVNTEGGTKNASTTVIDNRKSGDAASDASEKETQGNTQTCSFSDNDFEREDFLFETQLGDTLYFVTVKNNSSAVVSVKINGIAYDSSNSALGAGDGSIDVLGPGETSIAYLYFDGVSGIDHVDYQTSYKEEKHYLPVISNIKTEQTINDKNVTIVATNEGSYSAQFVEAYALFFDADNKVVSYSSHYITDNDSELKPNATISAQLDCYEDFDHVVCYLTGRADGSAAGPSNSISNENFEIKEKIYRTDYDDTMYFLVIKNNSDKAVGISGNMTAYDADSNVIGAANGEISVLGPGEESIAPFYFDSVGNIDHVNYTLSYNEDLYFSPVLSELEIVQNLNESNVVLSITNNGNKPAMFVEAYVLFLDASNNIVSYDSSYFTDDDSEIKPGETITNQLTAYDAFDHVECYVTGRAEK